MLFDLDGTLSDSAPGILGSLRHAFAANHVPPLDPATERALLGSPFYESLPPLIGADRVPAVIAAYRERYGNGGMLNATIFPGVVELLDALSAAGTTLAVATSKPEHFAVPVLEHLGLASYFATIGGDDLAGTLRTKALVIGLVLARLGRPDPAEILMVGDRSHDVVGARAHGIGTLAVTWGYAPPDELETAEPLAICHSPAEVADQLGVRIDAQAS